jgi:hypothetical protein
MPPRTQASRGCPLATSPASLRSPRGAGRTALQHLLRRAGEASELRLGVRKVDGRLDAHAWIEHQGAALMEAGDVRERFAPFAESIVPAGARER